MSLSFQNIIPSWNKCTLPCHEISEEKFYDKVGQNSRRFSPYLYRSHGYWEGDVRNGFNLLPGSPAIDLLKEDTGLVVYPPKKGGTYYTAVAKNDKESEKLRTFEEKLGCNIIISDLLSCSVALSINLNKDGQYSVIGGLEHKAKEYKCPQSILSLSEQLVEVIKKYPFYKTAELICPIPRSNSEEPQSLSEVLCNSVSRDVKHLSNLTEQIYWANKTVSIQGADFEKKWSQLESCGLEFTDNFNVKGRHVILLDDMYQSGCTMHYVASKILEKGASHVLGLALVKGRGDSDNRVK